MRLCLLAALVTIVFTAIPTGAYSPSILRTGKQHPILGIVHITYTGVVPPGSPYSTDFISTFINWMSTSNFTVTYGLIGLDMGDRPNFDVQTTNKTVATFKTHLVIIDGSPQGTYAFFFRFSYLAAELINLPYVIEVVADLNLSTLPRSTH